MDLRTQRLHDLIRSCLQGQETAYKELFDLFSPKMLALCHRYAKDKYEAEDWLQEGFIRAFNNLKSFKFEGSFEGWLRRIMINNALRNLNKPARKNTFAGLEQYLDPGVDAQVLHSLAAEEIINVVNKLPDGYRTIFNLNVVEGYSHKEISELLGINESTSRSQLVKAKRALRNKLRKLLKLAV